MLLLYTFIIQCQNKMCFHLLAVNAIYSQEIDFVYFFADIFFFLLVDFCFGISIGEFQFFFRGFFLLKQSFL
jgi:hypothetical protein